MPASTTTSIRLPKALKRELDRKARSSRRGKSWVIKEALELYLLGSSQDTLREEARKQSLLVSRHTAKAGADWTDQAAAEIEGWRA